MRPEHLREYVKQIARGAGFDRCGVARAEPIARGDYLRAFLAAGHAGSMSYLHRNLDKRLDPRNLLEGAQSAIVVALLYHRPEPPPTPADRPRGRVAMYAWGDDYHEVIREKLTAVLQRLRGDLAEPFEAKICVDTAPIIERELAAAAGVGWIGKNTLVLNRELGSYFFLGVMLTTLDIAPDQPVADHCGSCTACLEACPTQAFPAPYEMDASRCISYLTIEHRGDITMAFQEKMGDWLFGCDVCQEVCPFNRKAPPTKEPRFEIRPPGPQAPLAEILRWSTDDYRNNLRGSAVKRARLDMLQRNARIVWQNLCSPSKTGKL